MKQESVLILNIEQYLCPACTTKLEGGSHSVSTPQVNGWALFKDWAACAWGCDTPAVVWKSVYLSDS